MVFYGVKTPPHSTIAGSKWRRSGGSTNVNTEQIPPWWNGPAIHTAGSAENARKYHDRQIEHAMNALCIYTDGSGIDGHIGAAVQTASYTVWLELNDTSMHERFLNYTRYGSLGKVDLSQ